MPVVNVGGPVAWGLVVLLSAWAVRAGRALAGRRKARRNEEEDALVHDPNALQPRFLQHLSATAIRMLIETGALPCAILELAPDGNPTAAGGRANGPGHAGAGSGGGAPAHGPGRPGAASPPAAAAAGGRPGGSTAPAGSGAAAGAAGGAAGLAMQRIVPPELAAAVPCMAAAAWVRALAGPEPWRAELTRAANAAAAAAGVAGAGSPGAAGSSVRSSYASSYASSLGRDGGLGAGGLGAGGAAAGLRARLPQQQAQRLSLTLGTGGAALAHNGYGGGGGAVSHGAAGMGLEGAAGDGAAAADRRLSAAGDTSAEAAGSLGAGLGPGAGYGLNQYGVGGGGGGGGGPLHPHGAATALAAVNGGTTALAAAVAAAAAAAAANMASLPYPPRHALLVVLGRNERHVAAVTAAAAAAGYSRVATWVGTPEAFASTSLGGPRLPALSRHALWLVLQLGPDPLFHVPATVIDVRRPDERLSYGAIRGTINIPADELAAALALPPADFRQRYGVPQPSGPAEDVVVLLSRSGRRAAWAAQLCVDAGLRRVFVYGEGVYGWRLEDRVKPYRAYDLGALPPDPEPFALEEADEAAGLEELHTLGMPLRQGPRPSRFAVASPAAVGGPGAPGGGARGMAMGLGLGMGQVGGMLPPVPAGMAYTGGGGLGGMGGGMGGGPGRGGGAAPGGPGGAGHHTRGGSGAAREWGWRGRSMR
ncbi:hypothetical protein HXX76_006309 [Chlamydomonas incerta]|uniref:Rhodanese domain-containing protein n=1 Tax=Chlamydomonas incerta TaxID=51695 RepID=A0A835TDF2_CHLIN|nr:hypothetical protein HXX76_006309 [Chlamydomonas incerta]|eukprot:KAG2436785.1 hypothetical protein HXX76_006309 [Chlamydomonas incerta]